MQFSFIKSSLAGCATFILAGCASQQNVAPQYRLSSPSVQNLDGTSMLQRGRAQLDAGLDALAIESFRGELRFHPDQVDAYNGLGVAYGRIGRPDLAQRYFEMALAKDPNNTKVLANLAKLPGNGRAKIAPAYAATDTLPNRNSPTVFRAGAKQDDKSTVEILPKKGVLSARFAVASAYTILDKTSLTYLNKDPVTPIKRTPQGPDRPAPPLNAEIPFAARLERLSLNEVRLVTKSSELSTRPKPSPTFDSFGDRIALWLPSYMSAEQAASRYNGDEKQVIMAVMENKIRPLASPTAAPKLIAEPPEFAYVTYNQSSDVVGI